METRHTSSSVDVANTMHGIDSKATEASPVHARSISMLRRCVAWATSCASEHRGRQHERARIDLDAIEQRLVTRSR